ncbi:MAG TPA: tripartite tricarboxylate transporter TctB family protein [Candidatus Acidoferrum sp.]|nr:tripartite tricarboxylate transporter TctB family protein [Candidatus Acidoferrum sp.]
MTERVVALAMLIVSAIYLFQALRMPLGAAARPGPGFYPAAVGAFACVVALVVTALAFRRAGVVPVGEAVDAAPDDRRRVWITVATLAGFCLLMPWIGYPLAALVFVATLLRQFGAGWLGAVLTAVLSAEGSYYLFANLLGVTLPQGLWPH